MDKSALLTERLPRDTVPIEGVGTVTVRGLSRYELMLAGKGAENEDPIKVEQRMLAMAMVDPKMSEEDIVVWQKNSPASEMNPVIEKMNELSGVTKGAQKGAYKSLPDEPGA